MLSIFGNLPVLVWIFPVVVFIGTIFYTKKNVSTGAFDQPIVWSYVAGFTAAAIGLILLIGFLTNL